MRLFEKMRPVRTADLLDRLIGPHAAAELDWVDVVCKRLPALAILKGFDFAEQDIEFILPRVEQLMKIMLPNKTEQQVLDINAVAKDIYMLVERQIHRMAIADIGIASSENISRIYISNLIGLLIQSYDAGRGILGNALLQQFANRRSDTNDTNRDASYFQKSVIETLRFGAGAHMAWRSTCRPESQPTH